MKSAARRAVPSGSTHIAGQIRAAAASASDQRASFPTVDSRLAGLSRASQSSRSARSGTIGSRNSPAPLVKSASPASRPDAAAQPQIAGVGLNASSALSSEAPIRPARSPSIPTIGDIADQYG